MMNGIVWETNHSGKLKGMKSIGTCCANNKFCLARQKDKDGVCCHCYANTYMKMRKSLKEHLIENGEILKSKILQGNEIPVTNDLIYRFEAFGDLENETQLINYVNICNKNQHTKFGLWTKNYAICDRVFNKNGIAKPDNLSLIVSSLKMNEAIKLDMERYWFVDHIFTVYDKNYIKANNVDINCGAKSCLGCQTCYHRSTEFYVNEKLK